MRILRRMTGILLTAAVAASGVSYAHAEQASLGIPSDRLCCGDANGDGVITIFDCELLQISIAEYGNAYPFNMPQEYFDLICDANDDGNININDVTAIQRYLAEIETGTDNVGRSVVSLREISVKDARGNVQPLYETANKDYSYNIVNRAVSVYLAYSCYYPDDYDTTLVPDPEYGVYNDKPASLKMTLPKKAAETLIYDSDGRLVTRSSGSVIKNLKPGKYFYIINDKYRVRLQSGEINAEGQLRMIDAGGNTFNIRDIGGWECDGGTMRYEMIYRGCELDSDNYNVSLTKEQRSFFTNQLHIGDDIDLRSDAEVDGPDQETGTEDDISSSALGDNVDYIRLPLAPYTAGVNLSNPYQMRYYSTMLKRISWDVSEGKTSYIHCMAGADRTGTLCALVEAICGMSLNDIERDYEVTSYSAGNYRVRTSNSWKSLVTFLNGMKGENFRDKAITYARDIGVSVEEINALRRGLTDGEPETIK